MNAGVLAPGEPVKTRDREAAQPTSIRLNKTLSRRELLERVARWSVLYPLAASTEVRSHGNLLGNASVSRRRPFEFSRGEDAFLEEVEQAGFRYFWEQADRSTGLVNDRSRADGLDGRSLASIAATGFGLTALCIAESRGWEKPDRLKERALVTLRCLAVRAPHEHGFFFHWMNARTGERVRESEVSSIDTAILLCGVLTCRAHFADPEIRQLATQIYSRVDWPWMLNGGKMLSHGWKPETGFLRSRWDTYSELMMIYLLGLGSSTHPLPAETWDAWQRPVFDYEGEHFVGSRAPLFVHQFSQAWFNFRGKRDQYANYFENSVIATRVHKLWCQSLSKRFPDYSEDLWGITASDSAHGYVAWGGPPAVGPIDGTLVPSAPGGSLPFLPEDCLRVLRTMRERFGQKVWKRYGYVDAFNPLTNWFSADVIGIDAGITLLMAENARSGFVWNTFMNNDEVNRGMDRAGFRPDLPAQ